MFNSPPPDPVLLNKALSTALRHLRLNHSNLNTREFAKKVKLPKSVIISSELNTVNPTMRTLVAYAKYFKISVSGIVLLAERILQQQTGEPND